MIKKLLIANRGEIACRIINTCKKLGVETVAIYSDIDKHSKHVQMADQAFHIGPNPAAQSYLNVDKIINIAHDTKSQAIHPGFGFLSENAPFAETCGKENLIFVGPPPSAIHSMGSKSESKKIMTKAGVPVVEGYFGENQDPNFLLQEAKKIGFPVLIKAVSGGGGKGMKIVYDESEFFDSLESAKREAKKSFNDDVVLIEKFITKPRHIEFQVFGDHQGNYVYLFERDCSVQRRHQKVIEEAPSNLSPELRQKMGESAVDAAKSVGYYNAGTVEFIFDTDANNYYFMEMNTRLQVEHPISEMITGQDFVEWQLMVASGMPLPKKQNELSINGHAIEVRLYSEDPYNGFLPGSGKISYLREPVEDAHTRIETGVREKDEISIFYDPMIAKLITYGRNREQAIQKMSTALSNYKIGGLPNNVSFLKACFQHPKYISWDYDTNFIGLYKDELLKRTVVHDGNSLAAAILFYLTRNVNANMPDQFTNFRVNQPKTKILNFKTKLTQSNEEPKEVQATVHGPYGLNLYDITFTTEGKTQEFK